MNIASDVHFKKTFYIAYICLQVSLIEKIITIVFNLWRKTYNNIGVSNMGAGNILAIQPPSFKTNHFGLVTV